MTHYILVKVEADEVVPQTVVRELASSLDCDNLYREVGKAYVCDIRNVRVLDMLDEADLNSSCSASKTENS